MRLLDDTESRELHAAAVSADLASRRGALMAGIDGAFVAGLDVVTGPSEQIMIGLDALARAGTLSDDTTPLRTWLANAAQLAGKRIEVAVFERARDRLALPAPAPRVMSPAALLDALGDLLPAQLDVIVFKLGVLAKYLSGATAAPATRSVEVLRWAEQASRTADVVRLLAEVAGKATS